ncbi:hypothetical protein PanWU01x14_239180 [Parasponia andersonii]|uniref:Uncharacterized protein n=1 Tax=Parasponia andersonii TaxID=3476 RepID=A0A2P5BH72_PARAD|nr:hypothetical protein PanWU01x14_239180 [Parasponia andersonii]
MDTNVGLKSWTPVKPTFYCGGRDKMNGMDRREKGREGLSLGVEKFSLEVFSTNMHIMQVIDPS